MEIPVKIILKSHTQDGRGLIDIEYELFGLGSHNRSFEVGHYLAQCKNSFK